MVTGSVVTLIVAILLWYTLSTDDWLRTVEPPSDSQPIYYLLYLLCMPLSSCPVAWLLFRTPPGKPPVDSGPPTCRACGYYLIGNISGVCPECGTAVIVKPRLGPEDIKFFL